MNIPGSRFWALSLIWAIVLGCILFVPYSFFELMGASHHPAATSSAYANAYFWIAVGSVPLSVVFALSLTARKTPLKTSSLFSISIGFVVALNFVLLGARTLNPSPDYFRRYLGDATYAVPRIYGASKSTPPSQNQYLSARICVKTRKPQYGARCRPEKGSPTLDLVMLSSNLITSDFDTYYTLDRVGIGYTDDKLTFIPESDNIVLFSKGNLNGAIIYNGGHIFIWNEDNELQFSVSCSFTSYCKVLSQTPIGSIQYLSERTAEVDLERWRRDKAWFVNLFESWKCVEPTCAGKFPTGAK